MELKKKEKITRRVFLKRAGVIGGILGLIVGLNIVSFPQISFSQTKEPIKIGGIFPLTGVYSDAAIYLQEAAILAVEEWNDKGGVLGRKVELITRDDKAKPDEAARRTKELIEKEGVLLILGSIGAHTQLAMNEQAKLAKKIFASTSSSNEITQWPDVSPYTFHEAINADIVTNNLGQWVLKNFGKRWFFLTADYSFGWQITEGYRKIGKKLGVQEVGEIKHPLGASDYFPYFSKIIAAKPDVLLINNGGKDMVTSMKQAYAFGLKKNMKIVYPVFSLPARIGAGDDVAEGVYGGSTFVHELAEKLPSAKRFVAAYSKRWGKPPNDFAGHSYSAMNEVLSAIQRAGTLDTKQIILKLEGHEYDHYKGKQWWVPWSHQSIQDFYIVRSKAGEEKKDKWDVFELVEVIKASEKMDRTWKELGLKSDEPLSKMLD